ncbi:MAG: hypothetical protein WED00_06285 [Aquisalimonadaceae bacterium]
MASETTNTAFHDSGDVRHAAAALQVSEFYVFELAWKRWYGSDPDHNVIQYWYDPYMSDGLVPHWVRHFCSVVSERLERGELDPAEFGVPRRRPGASGAYQGFFYAVLLLAIVLVLFAEAQKSGEFMGLGGCFLPPCY